MAPRIFGRFLGSSVSTAAGFAVGGAVRPTLDPLTQELANRTWALHPDIPPDAYILAVGVAQGQIAEARARELASQTGYGDEAFSHLIEIANAGPGISTAMRFWRRGILGVDGLIRAGKRDALEDEFINAWIAAKDELLTPAQIAEAVQQGHMPEDGLLPPPVGGSPPFTIPLTQIPIDPSTEAEGSGITRARLEVMANLAGLPPGDIELLQMWNRGIIDESSVDAGIREGHRKTKWIPAVKQLRWAILSPIQYVEARLRGWIDDGEMYTGGLLSGMRKPEMDILFKTHGRPLSWHQVWIGLQRGGVYDGPTTAIAPAFLKALQESNIRPEWYNLAWAQRYSYPSAFVLRSLVQTHVLTQAEGEADLIDMGWRPDRAKQVATAWAQGAGATADTHLSKAQTQLWTTTHRSYIADESDDAAATDALAAAGVDPSTIPAVLALWQHERALRRKQLTPAQVKRAYSGGVTNQETGQPFTRDDALAALVERGYSVQSANEFLDL